MKVFSEPQYLPGGIAVEDIAEEAQQACFKVICDRLTEETGAKTWGDVDPYAARLLDELFRNFVLGFALNNEAIQSMQPENGQ